MKETPLNAFITSILRVQAGFAGMGGASAGIIGSAGTYEPLVNQLRSRTLAFAAEYVRPQPDKASLDGLAAQVEADLRSVRSIGGLSDDELDALLARLHDLLDQRAHK